jgi:transposase
MARREELTDEQWSLIEPLFDKPPVVTTRGRPRRAEREVLNGVLWILRSGARWCDLPDRFPPYQTCHRRFQQWNKDDRLRRVLETLAEDLHSRGGLDLSECFIDGTFVSAKKGALQSEKPSGAKVRSSWQWQMALVFLSPFTRNLLRRMKSNLSNKLFVGVLPMNDQSE